MKRSVYGFLVGLLLVPAVARAEMIQGMITAIDPANDTLGVRKSGSSQQLNIKVKSDTKTKNVASLKELQVGQQVKIDAKEDKSAGVWEAKSVEVTNTAS